MHARHRPQPDLHTHRRRPCGRARGSARGVVPRRGPRGSGRPPGAVPPAERVVKAAAEVVSGRCEDDGLAPLGDCEGVGGAAVPRAGGGGAAVALDRAVLPAVPRVAVAHPLLAAEPGAVAHVAVVWGAPEREEGLVVVAAEVVEAHEVALDLRWNVPQRRVGVAELALVVVAHREHPVHLVRRAAVPNILPLIERHQRMPAARRDVLDDLPDAEVVIALDAVHRLAEAAPRGDGVEHRDQLRDRFVLRVRVGPGAQLPVLVVPPHVQIARLEVKRRARIIHALDRREARAGHGQRVERPGRKLGDVRLPHEGSRVVCDLHEVDLLRVVSLVHHLLVLRGLRNAVKVEVVSRERRELARAQLPPRIRPERPNTPRRRLHEAVVQPALDVSHLELRAAGIDEASHERGEAPRNVVAEPKLPVPVVPPRVQLPVGGHGRRVRKPRGDFHDFDLDLGVEVHDLGWVRDVGAEFEGPHAELAVVVPAP
mmetsp:Transcript_33803/g.80021  ORF Transcript_33803/g.80021 Transcript_33803/m.80021 type:complete len:484 (-) Transcript_33803:70-1521(-)